MKAIEILGEEHGVIWRVLNTLETAAARAASGGSVRPLFFEDAAELVKGFADGCHHKKEEDVLFPALNRAGSEAESQLVNRMLLEHEDGRRLIRSMREGARRWEDGDETGRQAAVESAQAYVALLRRHIRDEDRTVFPAAQLAIPEVSQEQLADAFDHIEHEETGEGVHEKYLALAESLEAEMERF
jgi:hemerythrin-like domain-containing protein